MITRMFAEERVRHKVQEHISEESTRSERDHRVERGRLEGSRYREQDEIGDAAVSLAGMRPNSRGDVESGEDGVVRRAIEWEQSSEEALHGRFVLGMVGWCGEEALGLQVSLTRVCKLTFSTLARATAATVSTTTAARVVLVRRAMLNALLVVLSVDQTSQTASSRSTRPNALVLDGSRI